MNNAATYSEEKLHRLPLHEYYARLNLSFIEKDGWLMPRRFSDVADEVRLLERGDAIVDFSDHGFLLLEGRDAVDFLNRISTNDFRTFRFGDSLQTILVTEKGRIIDSIIVVHRRDHLLLIVGRGAQDQVKQWIERFIISDDVRVVDRTGKYLLFATFHPQHVLEISVEGDTCYAFHVKYFDDDAVFYCCEDTSAYPDMLRPLIHDQAGNDAFEFYSIQHGISHYKKEILDEFNPLELNLWNQISFVKGCYIGQEVIARLDTYKKIQRSLCRFRTDGRLLPDTEYRLVLDGKEIGKITSVVAVVGSEDSFVGLAVLKKEFAIFGGRYFLADHPIAIIIEHAFVHNEGRNGNNNDSR